MCTTCISCITGVTCITWLTENLKSIYYWLTWNLKSRDASAFKNQFTEWEWKIWIVLLLSKVHAHWKFWIKLVSAEGRIVKVLVTSQQPLWPQDRQGWDHVSAVACPQRFRNQRGNFFFLGTWDLVPPRDSRDERQKLSLSHFAFAIALLSGWGPTSSTHLSFHLVFSLVPRNFSLGDEPFAEPSAGMSEGYGQLLLLNAVRSQRGLLIWVFPSVSLMHIRGSFYQCVTLSVWERRNNFLTQSAEVTNAKVTNANAH